MVKVAVFFSRGANTFGKDMNPTILPPSTGKLEVMVTGLGEENSEHNSVTGVRTHYHDTVLHVCHYATGTPRSMVLSVLYLILIICTQ